MSFSESLSLLQAVTSRDERSVKALLSEGADVNARNNSGQTPLILAIVSGQDHLLRLLLEAGANPLLRDHTQLNAIDWAERKGRSDLLQILRTPEISKAGAAIDEVTPETSKAAPIIDKVIPEINKAGFIAHQVTPEIGIAPLSTDDAIPEIFPQTIAEISPAPTHGVQLASTQPTKPSSSRKRCPKCNTIYNSELLAYCAYHIVPLIDADEAIVISKANNSAPVLWVLVLITLSLAGVVGVFLSGYMYENNDRPGSSAPTVTTTRQGIPLLGSTLVGKSVNLPAAEIRSQTPQETATITVRVRIDRGGRVVAASSSEGDQLLREAVIEAAKKSTFSVEKLRGRGAEGTITYTFSQ